MISVTNLKKNYGATPALKGISFNIKEGEFYGLLGPNGAGKTTTISIMSTILEPSEGTVTIASHDLAKEPVACKRVIGVVSQEIALYNQLSAYDNLLFWGGMYKVPKAELKLRIDETLRLFGLFDRRNDKIKAYSGGMKRRINIASAILHRPQVLFLDEPTVGIDPQSRNLIYEVLETLHNQGMTMVYTTHYMEEAERFCNRIGVIDNGQIIAEGTLDELKAQSNMMETVMVACIHLPDGITERLSGTWKNIRKIENTLHFFTPHAKTDLSKIILQCSEMGLDIQNIDLKKVNLETIFLSITGKKLRD